MIITINNCNNIDNADVTLELNRLNIKYAINGTGKSTIAKAISMCINGNDLSGLLPFKYREQNDDGNNLPNIQGLTPFSSSAIFDEDYISNFVFKQDEVIENSFEVFIKNNNYENRLVQIENLIKDIKNTFNNSDDLQNFLLDLNELSSCFGKSKSGYSAAGSIGKGLGNGNKIKNIPESLKKYRPFLTSDHNTQWVKWQISGNNFLDISTKCPYCATSVKNKKDSVQSVAKEYDSKMIDHLNKVVDVFEKLNKYFITETKKKIKEITQNISGITPEQKNYLIEIKSQIDVLIKRLNNIKELSFFSFNDVEKVIDTFNECKFDISYFSHLNTRNTNKLIKSLNNSIDCVLQKAGILQGEINKHKKGIQETIQVYKDDINEFLKFAGYKYEVYIELDDDEKYRMKLKHKDFVQPISEANNYLSFGERNAFSLILFMFDSIKKNVDLVILDDPISSFDKNKKFAILNRIFRGKKSFRDKTVLLLTHDFEPLIDIIYNLHYKFQPKPCVNFLKIENSIIHEIEILKSDIKLFNEIAIENIRFLNDDINKLIYLRRLFELNIDKNESYHLISSIFHKRDEPKIRIINNDNTPELVEMDEDAILRATTEIQEYINNFNYYSILERVKDDSQIVDLYKSTSNNYEKLQVFRILFPNSEGSDVIHKFINESYHIENDYLLQLNPCKYDLVPNYVIDLCDQKINQYFDD